MSSEIQLLFRKYGVVALLAIIMLFTSNYTIAEENGISSTGDPKSETSSLPPDYEDETGGLDSDLDPSNARYLLQNDYAINMWGYIEKALKAYERMCSNDCTACSDNCVVPEEAFKVFTDALLSDGKDPLVKEIKYEPNEMRITIVMRSNDYVNPGLIEPLLGGEEFVYEYQDGKWLSTTVNQDDIRRGQSKLVENAKDVITRYCDHPRSIKYSDKGEWWLDTTWCSYWHTMVRPPLR